jgi:hypothetical protein
VGRNDWDETGGPRIWTKEKFDEVFPDIPPFPGSTAEELFAALHRARPGTTDRLIGFLTDCQDLQITWEVNSTIIVWMIVGEYKVVPLVVYANGAVDTGYCWGLKHLLRGFAQMLAASIPGTVARETPKTWTVTKIDGGRTSVWDVLDHAAGCRVALEELNRALSEVAGEE